MSYPNWTQFNSILADQITRFLSAKRSVGCRFESEDRTLRLLDRFIKEKGITTLVEINSAFLNDFLASRPRKCAMSYNALLSTVRRLFEWIVEQQELNVSPLCADPRTPSNQLLPYLFDTGTIHRLLIFAEELPDGTRSPDRGATYATIFSLLAGLGLRVGEAARLQCGDIDMGQEVLLVRNSKFGKSRLVPFGPRLARRLQVYSELREKRCGFPVPDAPYFTWNRRSAIATNSIRNAFRDHLVPRLGLTVPDGTRAPCVHSLRHSFAIRTLLGWYRKDVDVQGQLYKLSTFLGHAGLNSTAVYLTITDELLQAGSKRFEALATNTVSEVRT
jgi:site-specific recombinase XerD